MRLAALPTDILDEIMMWSPPGSVLTLYTSGDKLLIFKLKNGGVTEFCSHGAHNYWPVTQFIERRHLVNHLRRTRAFPAAVAGFSGLKVLSLYQKTNSSDLFDVSPPQEALLSLFPRLSVLQLFTRGCYAPFLKPSTVRKYNPSKYIYKTTASRILEAMDSDPDLPDTLDWPQWPENHWINLAELAPCLKTLVLRDGLVVQYRKSEKFTAALFSVLPKDLECLSVSLMPCLTPIIIPHLPKGLLFYNNFRHDHYSGDALALQPGTAADEQKLFFSLPSTLQGLSVGFLRSQLSLSSLPNLTRLDVHCLSLPVEPEHRSFGHDPSAGFSLPYLPPCLTSYTVASCQQHARLPSPLLFFPHKTIPTTLQTLVIDFVFFKSVDDFLWLPRGLTHLGLKMNQAPRQTSYKDMEWGNKFVTTLPPRLRRLDMQSYVVSWPNMNIKYLPVTLEAINCNWEFHITLKDLERLFLMRGGVVHLPYSSIDEEAFLSPQVQCMESLCVHRVGIQGIVASMENAGFRGDHPDHSLLSAHALRRHMLLWHAHQTTQWRERFHINDFVTIALKHVPANVTTIEESLDVSQIPIHALPRNLLRLPRALKFSLSEIDDLPPKAHLNQGVMTIQDEEVVKMLEKGLPSDLRVYSHPYHLRLADRRLNRFLSARSTICYLTDQAVALLPRMLERLELYQFSGSLRGPLSSFLLPQTLTTIITSTGSDSILLLPHLSSLPHLTSLTWAIGIAFKDLANLGLDQIPSHLTDLSILQGHDYGSLTSYMPFDTWMTYLLPMRNLTRLKVMVKCNVITDSNVGGLSVILTSLDLNSDSLTLACIGSLPLNLIHFWAPKCQKKQMPKFLRQTRTQAQSSST